MLKTLLPLVLALAVLATGCKKNNANKTTCTSTLYGYKTSYPATMGYLDGSSVFGIINQSTAAMTALSSSPVANDGIYDNRAAFNTSDNHYYLFGHDWFDTGFHAFDTLLKISSTGAVTHLLPASPGIYACRDVLYSQATNKLYCLKYGILCEITISGSSYTTTPICADTIGIISAIDNAGDMYYVAGDTITRTIRKVHPGSPASTLVASMPGWWIFGLCYNNNDNKLYGIRYNYPSPGYDFIKIDPATGTGTSLSTLGFNVNHEFFSAVIDECSNRYVLSSTIIGFGTGADSSYIKQISMAGSVVQSNIITDGIYLDLAIH